MTEMSSGCNGKTKLHYYYKTSFVAPDHIDHLDSKTLPSFCTQVDIMADKFHSLLQGTNTVFHRLSLLISSYEPPHGKTNNLHRRKQSVDQLRGNREADQRLCFRYSDSTIFLLLKSEISCF